MLVGAQSLDDDGELQLGEGECFGEMARLADSPRTASVVALTEVTVWRLSRAPAWMAVGVFAPLFVVGVLDQAALQSGANVSFLVYSGIVLSVGDVFAALGIDAWLAALVRDGMPAMGASPYGFVVVLALVAFLLRFLVPWMTLVTVLALVAMPVAEGLGIHPFVPVLVILVASDHTFLPYVNVGYSLLYFPSDGELFSHAQARVPLMVEALIRLVAP